MTTHSPLFQNILDPDVVLVVYPLRWTNSMMPHQITPSALHHLPSKHRLLGSRMQSTILTALPVPLSRPQVQVKRMRYVILVHHLQLFFCNSRLSLPFPLLTARGINPFRPSLQVVLPLSSPSCPVNSPSPLGERRSEAFHQRQDLDPRYIRGI